MQTIHNNMHASYSDELLLFIYYFHVNLNILICSFCPFVKNTMIQGEVYIMTYIIYQY